MVSAWLVPLFSPYAVVYGNLIEEAMQAHNRAARERVMLWRGSNPIFSSPTTNHVGTRSR
ncbi:hypothetical protein [Nonomuraea sp. NPDC049480]|uniref:hypothetical protein n=1 Tax=Nonomuraea sp. NPDC049480 TaxID=3364353 RepID=UPI002E511A6C|nr:hypothetical protein [Nonomuraea sp.]